MIYAFTTSHVPGYLKVGDTMRGVDVRLNEWSNHFSDLKEAYRHSARIDDNTIFRDIQVHRFLKDRHRLQLQKTDFPNLSYYSREFFKDATPDDVKDAIDDIKKSAAEGNGKYHLYTAERLPQVYKYKRTESYSPRDNQQQAIDNFVEAYNAGRTNLLLYAVMRFGKSFTAMCCASAIDARLVVIVSAKADVKEEWKKTVESHVRFSDYDFMDSDDLKRDTSAITQKLDSGRKTALFLTLQDLQGETIKERHKELFSRAIDLLIIDETHFGARAESYGRVLQEQSLDKRQIKAELDDIEGFETLDKVEASLKVLQSKVRLHLSGTPYRILMSDEFRKEDIIAFVQFTDIIDARDAWDEEYLNKPDEGEYGESHEPEDNACSDEGTVNEWENPYFGFPQMIRFAFQPSDGARRKMEELKANGRTHAFSELFRPQKMAASDATHRKFAHEPEVLELLHVIDGSKDDPHVLGFLNYDKIKQGKMCRHIVCVLPFRASCDAMSRLLRTNADKFINLKEYKVLNIAGFDDAARYPSTKDITNLIAEAEEKGEKTITLTVNRMLTGSTVPQWDTMIYLKGTSSPQEYDQAIFRLQNQHIANYRDDEGRSIKHNLKPQTLLVDFDPARMFRLQELKSQFYNVNTDMHGNSKLKERIERELAISPIVVVNKDRLTQATPTDITDAVRQYSTQRSIMNDAEELPVDMNLLHDNAIAEVLKDVSPIDSKSGLQIKPTEGEGDMLDIPDTETPDPGESTDEHTSDGPDNRAANTPESADENDDRLLKSFSAYYARILFYAFLTDDTVKSLEDVIACIDSNSENSRIAVHLGLSTKTLRVINDRINPFILRKLDYKIENINQLGMISDIHAQGDDDGEESFKRIIERVQVALNKFGRLSVSEVVTPSAVADRMTGLLPDDIAVGNESPKFLDIASKQGEFAISLFKRFKGKVKDGIYSIPTSPVSYEFTRKTYKLLGMPLENVFADFTSYDLIKEKENAPTIIERLRNMKFDLIIGNPPYQENDGGGVGDSAGPIYNRFVVTAISIEPDYIDIIMPARWLKGGKGLSEFRRTFSADERIAEIYDFEKSSECFPNVHIDGGICFFLWKASLKGQPRNIKYTYKDASGETIVKNRSLHIHHGDTIARDYRQERIIAAANKLRDEETGKETVTVKFSEIVSSRNPYDIGADLFNKPQKYPDITIHQQPVPGSIKVDGVQGVKGGSKRVVGYITSNKTFKNAKSIDKGYKIFFSKAYMTTATVPPSFIVAEPGEACTETFLKIGDFDKLSHARNCGKYIRTKFFRALLFFNRSSLNISRSTFNLIPLEDFTDASDIDWSADIADIDRQLYRKYKIHKDDIKYIESKIEAMPLQSSNE